MVVTVYKEDFGVCFDINGVLSRNSKPKIEAVSGLRSLTDPQTGQFKVPTVFVTNTLEPNDDKAAELSRFFGIRIGPEQLIQVQSPLEMFSKFHHKRCLFLGQGNLQVIGADLGFTNIVTIEEIAEEYPELGVREGEVVDRPPKSLEETNQPFEKIEALMCLGEPADWDLTLQLTLDVLMTDGHPHKPYIQAPRTSHIPVIAANLDLNVQLEESKTPRFSHGAFLLCLETLYLKLTGHELAYTALMGKPSEVTYRYVEHRLNKLATQMNHNAPLHRLYIIGDNMESDIVGANLYQEHIVSLRQLESDPTVAAPGVSLDVPGLPRPDSTLDFSLPESRRIPRSDTLTPQSVEDVRGILVKEGVFRSPSLAEPPSLAELEATLPDIAETPQATNYTIGPEDPAKPGTAPRRRSRRRSDLHRDFEPSLEERFMRPTASVRSVLDAVHYIKEMETNA